MPKLSPIGGRKLTKIFLKSGFVEVRQKGSHVRLEHPDGRKTSIPLHSGENVGWQIEGMQRQREIGKGLMQAIRQNTPQSGSPPQA